MPSCLDLQGGCYSTQSRWECQREHRRWFHPWPRTNCQVFAVSSVDLTERRLTRTKSHIANAVDQIIFRTARSMSRWIIFIVLGKAITWARSSYMERVKSTFELWFAPYDDPISQAETLQSPCQWRRKLQGRLFRDPSENALVMKSSFKNEDGYFW